MLSLHELQKKFVAGLNKKSSTILNYIYSDSNLSAMAHFEIYQSSIKGALQEVLKEIYPVCYQLVGEEFFNALSNEYIANYPSYSADIAHYGHRLADFLEQFSPAQTLPYLADTARLEWAWHKLFTAPVSKKFDFVKLANSMNNFGESIIFTLPHASTLLVSAFPIHLIWQANQENQDNSSFIKLTNNETHYYLVWRSENVMRIDLLSYTHWQILSWITAGLPFPELCKKIQEYFDGISIEKVIAALIGNNWIVDFYLGDESCR